MAVDGPNPCARLATILVPAPLSEMHLGRWLCLASCRPAVGCAGRTLRTAAAMMQLVRPISATVRSRALSGYPAHIPALVTKG